MNASMDVAIERFVTFIHGLQDHRRALGGSGVVEINERIFAMEGLVEDRKIGTKCVGVHEDNAQ
jgi:hypothetical protein